MPDTSVDVAALYGALDAARASKQLSWRELARMIGVSASTMSRLAQKQNPDVNAFAKMVRWLNVPAEAFIVEDGRPVNRSPGEEEPELVAQLAPLLRARSDLKPHDVDLLESLIESAVRRFNADRASAGE